ncbi:MAG: FAD:protein FMN transferase [Spirosomataceae bacterium]
MKPSLLIIFAVAVFASCQHKPQYTYLEGEAQGTTFRIVYEGTQDLSSSVDSLFRVIDHSMSLWDSTSIISKLNANQTGVKADLHFALVFQKSQQIAKITEGAFDITVGPLVKTWGFSYKKGLPFPTQKQTDSLLKLIDYRKVRLENGIFIKANPHIEIDFNAIAQGYTVDVMADFLKSNNSQNYLVEIGGEVRAQGKNEKGQLWKIGIDKPTNQEASGRPLQAVVALNNKSLATSGSYRKFVERNGKKYSHAIDPKTGLPITHQLLSISVIANDCMTADAYATAFLVMGLEKAKPLAQQLQLEWYGIYALPNGQIKAASSSHFFE